MALTTELEVGNLYYDHEEDVFLYIGKDKNNLSYCFIGVDKKRTNIPETFYFPDGYICRRLTLLSKVKPDTNIKYE